MHYLLYQRFIRVLVYVIRVSDRFYLGKIVVLKQKKEYIFSCTFGRKVLLKNTLNTFYVGLYGVVTYGKGPFR